MFDRRQVYVAAALLGLVELLTAVVMAGSR